MSGHFGRSGRYDALCDLAEQYAFVFACLGMAEFRLEFTLPVPAALDTVGRRFDAETLGGRAMSDLQQQTQMPTADAVPNPYRDVFAAGGMPVQRISFAFASLSAIAAGVASAGAGLAVLALGLLGMLIADFTIWRQIEFPRAAG